MRSTITCSIVRIIPVVIDHIGQPCIPRLTRIVTPIACTPSRRRHVVLPVRALAIPPRPSCPWSGACRTHHLARLRPIHRARTPQQGSTRRVGTPRHRTRGAPTERKSYLSACRSPHHRRSQAEVRAYASSTGATRKIGTRSALSAKAVTRSLMSSRHATFLPDPRSPTGQPAGHSASAYRAYTHPTGGV